MPVVKLNTSKHSNNGPRHIVVAALLGFASVTACGQNLISNGSFESGATLYTTGYGANDTTPTLSGQAGVRSSGNSGTGGSPIFNSGNTSLAAKDGTKFFAVSGSTTADTTVWQQTVAIAANFSYTLSFWVAAGDANSVVTSPNQKPTISVTINGVTTGMSANSITVGPTPGTYTQFTATWNSGTATSAVIRLVDSTVASAGNDFVLDDIRLVPEPGTYAAGVFLVGAGFFAWRKARRQPGTAAK